MQTIYTTTANFVRHEGNLVDLQAYRRRLALTQEGSLAPSPREDSAHWEPARPEEAPRLRVLEPRRELGPSRRARRERRAAALDACASLGVVIMTLAFTLRLVLG